MKAETAMYLIPAVILGLVPTVLAFFVSPLSLPRSSLPHLSFSQKNEPDFSSFNPFQQQESLSGFNPFEQRQTQINLRKLQMSELTTDMLLAVEQGDDEQIQDLLTRNKDMLLEPLEIGSSEPDSIYTPEMTRSQRYQAYHQNLAERITQAKNKSVAQVLEAMSDYVLSFQDDVQEEKE
jgi:hypothetical protein